MKIISFKAQENKPKRASHPTKQSLLQKQYSLPQKTSLNKEAKTLLERQNVYF